MNINYPLPRRGLRASFPSLLRVCQLAVAGVLSAWVAMPGAVRADALPRMKPEPLRATREAIAALAIERQPVSLSSGFTDYRAVMHVHSLLSHDSRSPLEEVVAGAKAVGAQVILFNEHPAPHYDYVTEGHRGMHDGVLIISGAETQGFLAFPRTSLRDEKPDSPQAFADLVNSTGGMIFTSHLEERMDWQIAGLTGNEIYNTHADIKEEAKLLATLRNPLSLMALKPLLEEYPQETYSALLDYPADYLRRWDELCQTARHTGVAANDAHHNVGIRVVLLESGKVRIEDLVGEKLVELDPKSVAFLRPLVEGKSPGDVVFSIDLDPYPRSLKHVSTHLLMHELTEEAVREALRESRAYVAFDWLADPTGFVYQARQGESTFPQGAELVFQEGLRLQAETPLPGFFRLLRDGTEVRAEVARSFEHTIDQPGIYRVEVWLNIAGERRPWILSNPIYIRPAAPVEAASP